MLNTNNHLLFEPRMRNAHRRADECGWALCAARGLYDRAWRRGGLSRLWTAVMGRNDGLIALSEIEARCTIHDRCYAGLQTVGLRQIRGSVGRCGDFDADFRPLRSHNRDRWLNVAAVRLTGGTLPPVALVEIGGVYFVQDGHHRISVAQALGQDAIDAAVTSWQVTGPLPWETSGRARTGKQGGTRFSACPVGAMGVCGEG